MSENISNILSRIDILIDEIQKQLGPVFNKDSPLFDFESLNKKDNAKLQISLAYTMNSLYLISMKLQGFSTVNHPIISDMVNFDF